MDERRRRALLRQMVEEHGPALARLCAGYEAIEAKRQELEQEIVLNLWRALPSFRGESSLRTWMYRVAHNVATRHVQRAVREPATEEDLDEVEAAPPSGGGSDAAVDRRRARRRLRELVAALRPIDRQLIQLYFEDVPQKEIAAVTGLSQANVSTRVHRIKGELMEAMKRERH